ncbi:CheY-like chemotaxis protein [Streptomyces sp. MJP52]|nr:CheY-like chemotaxis protein [Streptomyces sp. MJP52]
MPGGAPDADVVAEAAGGAKARTLAARHLPDAVLADVRTAGTDGPTATGTPRGARRPPQAPVPPTAAAPSPVRLQEPGATA